MTWNEIKSERQEPVHYWKPNIGDELIGVLKEFREGDFEKQAVIVNAEGEEIVMPSHVHLKNLLKDIALNTEVKIKLVREEPTSVKGKNPMKIYELFVNN